MGKKQISTTDAPAPAGSYSQGIVAGDYLFLSGQVPRNPDGTSVTGGFTEQARRVFANLAAVAAAAGASLAQAVRVGVFLEDMANFAELNRIFLEVFPEPLPARTTIQTPLRGMGIEVDVVIYLGD